MGFFAIGVVDAVSVRSGRSATNKARPTANNSATAVLPNAGNVAPTRTPANAGRSPVPARDGSSLNPVGRQQVLRRQDARQAL